MRKYGREYIPGLRKGISVKIVQVYKDVFPEVHGGIERYIHDLSQFLVSRGHGVEILVAGGRGVESEKGFALIQELAEELNGAVAASRAAVDSGWISYPHQVGQTGKTVCPNLYIACGISGAIQHAVGMQSAETVVAINRDENAPIFDIATYGLVGDLFEIIPLLTRKIREQRGS